MLYQIGVSNKGTPKGAQVDQRCHRQCHSLAFTWLRMMHFFLPSSFKNLSRSAANNCWHGIHYRKLAREHMRIHARGPQAPSSFYFFKTNSTRSQMQEAQAAGGLKLNHIKSFIYLTSSRSRYLPATSIEIFLPAPAALQQTASHARHS